MGNLLPGILSVPALVGGLILFRLDDPFNSLPLLLMFGSSVVGWLLINCLGLYDNSTMRTELGRRLDRDLGAEPRRQIFIGYSKPKFRSILDPHENVGFLIIEPDKWILFGEQAKRIILTKDILEVSWRKNTHSSILLGGFLRLDYRDSTGIQTVNIESREKGTLLANRKVTRALVKEFSPMFNPADSKKRQQKTSVKP